MSKENNDVFFGYYKSGKILGVSKSDQSDAKFLKGATSIEKVEVKRSTEVQKDLKTERTFGRLEGFFLGTAAAAAAFGAYQVVSWACRKVCGWFGKEGK